MQELQKILKEIDETIERYGKNPYIDEKVTDLCYGLNLAKDIIRKHMNDGWIPVEKRLPEKEYDTVLCVTDKNYYLVCVYNKNVGFRISDFSTEGRIVAWRPFQIYTIQKKTTKQPLGERI